MAPPLALVKCIAELGDLERAVGDGGESYLEALAAWVHSPELLEGMREAAVPFLRQLGALGRGRVIRSVAELACRFSVSAELLMTCTNTLVIQGELMKQLRSLSLYDGGLLGILLERCPTTSIGSIPIMQIRQNMSESLDLAGAQLGACEVGLLSHYLAINRSLTQIDFSNNALDQNMKAALGNALLANPFRPVQYVLCDDWSVDSTVEVELSSKQLLPGDALLLAGVLKGTSASRASTSATTPSGRLAQASSSRASSTDRSPARRVEQRPATRRRRAARRSCRRVGRASAAEPGVEQDRRPDVERFPLVVQGAGGEQGAQGA